MTRPTAIDTSVAIPLLVASHDSHHQVTGWATERILHLCGHALVETYAVLTRLPGDARVTPSDAVQLIDERFADPLTLSLASAREVHRLLAAQGIAGGAVYDGLIALTAREHGATLATRDARARSTYGALNVRVEVVGDDEAPDE